MGCSVPSCTEGVLETYLPLTAALPHGGIAAYALRSLVTEFVGRLYGARSDHAKAT
jgi:hypothetical protein